MKTNTVLLASAVALLGSTACVRNPPSATPEADYKPGQYQVFTGSGTPASLDDVVRAMAAQQVVFIGETHDDPTGHMLELELWKRAALTYGAARPVALSLEFFERDVQATLDEYLAGGVADSTFRAGARPWPRYQTDYRPLIEFSKEQKFPVIAANAPRRYVTMVSRQGRAALDGLSAEERVLLAPLPYGKASPAYRSQWIAMISRVMEQEGKKCGVAVAHADAPPGTHQNMGNQLDSQVLWDATMAHSIARYLERHPNALVLHMVGGFHVERGTGTPEQLQSYAPGTRSLIVSLRPVDAVQKFEPAPEGTWGDFVIQTEKARTLEAIECRQFLAERDRK
ncbi:MAG TPA: ChaN family lipoprotein [Longimicrobiales bacterium]|nr:ChaN family lipoprotein [Longimicrobiales bacterium]